TPGREAPTPCSGYPAPGTPSGPRVARPELYGRGLGGRFPLRGPPVPVAVQHCPKDHGGALVGTEVLRPMTNRRRCAIYTCKSTEEGLEQDFNGDQLVDLVHIGRVVLTVVELEG